jgi:uncharacterized protein YcbX
MFVAELWRFPVKSMGGERLDRCELTLDGIPGDRRVLVADEDGEIVTARGRPRLLLHHAKLSADGEVLVDGRPWRDPSVARDVRAAAGEDTRLVALDGPEGFDVLPLLVATDGALAELGYDSRRFRSNIIIGGVTGYAERGWEGRRLSIGGAVIAAVKLRQRCIMTTFDPNTVEQDVEVLKRIHRELDGNFALDCLVETAGWVQINDPVALLD